MPGIVVIGNISIRLVIEVPHLPVPGESVQGGPLRSYAGGKGANQATAAARAGAQVALLGRVGIDEFGRANLTALQDQGVDVSAVGSDQTVGTGVAMVAVDTDGEFLLFTSPGANQTLSPAHVRSADFGSPDLVLGVVEVQTEAVVQAFKIAHDAGAPTVLSAESAHDVSAELLDHTDYLIVNRIQSSVLTGFKVTDAPTARRAATALRSRVSGAAIVTLGEDGAVVDLGDGPLDIGTFVVEAHDNSVAGDAFAGAFAARMVAKRSPLDALAFASAAAAISVSRTGCQSSLASRDEMDKILSR
jgi:ribokinase